MVLMSWLSEIIITPGPRESRHFEKILYSPPLVDRVWYNKIPIYPIFYVLKEDYNPINPKP